MSACAKLARIKRLFQLEKEMCLLLQVLPILKTPFPLPDQATLPWTVMEVIRVVTRAAPLVAHRRNTRRRHLGHPVKAVHPPLIKVCLTVHNSLTMHAIRFIFTSINIHTVEFIEYICFDLNNERRQEFDNEHFYF